MLKKFLKTFKETHKGDISVNCDYCNFKSVREESRIAHMITEQEESLFGYIGGKYFGTRKVLKTTI